MQVVSGFSCFIIFVSVSSSRTFYYLLNSMLRNWESLCDIGPDCHHHFDASGTLNVMFDELAERPDKSLSRDETYVCKANHCKIFTRSSGIYSCVMF